jgi:hypothetical protein
MILRNIALVATVGSLGLMGWGAWEGNAGGALGLVLSMAFGLAAALFSGPLMDPHASGKREESAFRRAS